MKIRLIDIFLTLDKNHYHPDWLHGVAQVFRGHTGVTENVSERHEHLRQEDATGCHSGELIEMATIMSIFSEILMAYYTDRNEQIRLLC